MNMDFHEHALFTNKATWNPGARKQTFTNKETCSQTCSRGGPRVRASGGPSVGVGEGLRERQPMASRLTTAVTLRRDSRRARRRSSSTPTYVDGQPLSSGASRKRAKTFDLTNQPAKKNASALLKLDPAESSKVRRFSYLPESSLRAFEDEETEA